MITLRLFLFVSFFLSSLITRHRSISLCRNDLLRDQRFSCPNQQKPHLYYLCRLTCPPSNSTCCHCPRSMYYLDFNVPAVDLSNRTFPKFDEFEENLLITTEEKFFSITYPIRFPMGNRATVLELVFAKFPDTI